MATHTSTGAYGTPAGAPPEFAPANVLPRNVSDRIWAGAREQAIFPSLSDNVPVILGENVLPTLTKRPAASVVGEGEDKDDSQIGFGSKVMKPIKAVVGLEFTMEAIRQNPLGVLGLMEAELTGALARQIDLAVAHNLQASTGTPLDAREHLAQAAHTVYLGDYASADEALWAGYGAVVDGGTGDLSLAPHDFTGFALDPRMVFALANERDENGRRVNPDIPMGGSVASYSGQKVAVGRGVSGQFDASADTGIRAIGGDWNALKFGYAMDIFTKKIEYGNPFGHGDLQRRNAVAYMAEVIFGWGIMDLGAFAVYRNGTAEDDPEPGDDD